MTLHSSRDDGDDVVSIVVPTMANARRETQLVRAVQSISEATARPVKIIACVNGDQWTQSAVNFLAHRDGVELHMLPKPSLPDAIAHGRRVVTTPFFGFLDDDDELLPGSLDRKLNLLSADQGLDVVCGNGVRRRFSGDEPMFSFLRDAAPDPLMAMFREIWLVSCGALYRSSSIPVSYFEDQSKFAEWTWLAFCLALDGKKLGFDDRPGFIVNETSGSLSKSTGFSEAYLALYQRMLNRRPPQAVRREILKRMANAAHDMSDAAYMRGDLRAAGRHHLASLSYPGGLRYLGYTLRLARLALGRRQRP